jgi:hypothetical protein
MLGIIVIAVIVSIASLCAGGGGGQAVKQQIKYTAAWWRWSLMLLSIKIQIVQDACLACASCSSLLR